MVEKEDQKTKFIPLVFVGIGLLLLVVGCIQGSRLTKAAEKTQQNYSTRGPREAEHRIRIAREAFCQNSTSAN